MTRNPTYNTALTYDAESLESAPGVRRAHHGSVFGGQQVTPAFNIESTKALVVIYKNNSAPKVSEIAFIDVESFCDTLVLRTAEALQEFKSPIPNYVISEIIHNFIFANFQDIVISVFNEGRSISFSDRGPGINDIAQSVRVGFSSATAFHKRHIRGAGAGFEVVHTYMRDSGGTLSIENNIDGGTVITLELPHADSETEPTPKKTSVWSAEGNLNPSDSDSQNIPTLFLNERQQEVLEVSSRYSEIGPQLISDILGIALSTAYRDLTLLESLGLLSTKPNGKRVITEVGLASISKKETQYDS